MPAASPPMPAPMMMIEPAMLASLRIGIVLFSIIQTRAGEAIRIVAEIMGRRGASYNPGRRCDVCIPLSFRRECPGDKKDRTGPCATRLEDRDQPRLPARPRYHGCLLYTSPSPRD